MSSADVSGGVPTSAVTPSPVGSNGGWLPARGVLLHVGPPKTGTTALQTALTAAKVDLERQGVLYPVSGPRTQHARAAAAALGKRLAGSDAVEPLRSWAGLLAQVDHRSDRAVISSELFADATDDHMRRIRDDVGAADLHVLITLRPLESLLASTWQQDLKGGRPQDYDSWLDERLNGPRDHVFWRRNQHHQLVARWAAVLSPQRVAVLIVDAARPEAVLRDCEQIIGLDTGTLQLQRGNRSLSRQEAELLRLLHTRLGSDLDPRAVQRWLRQGGFKAMIENRGIASDEDRIETPAWALSRAREIHAPIVAEILQSGVHVVGHPDALLPTRVPDPPGEEVIDLREPSAATVPMDAAVELVAGLFEAAQRDYAKLQAQADSASAEPVSPATVSPGRLRRVVLRARRRKGR